MVPHNIYINGHINISLVFDFPLKKFNVIDSTSIMMLGHWCFCCFFITLNLLILLNRNKNRIFFCIYKNALRLPASHVFYVNYCYCFWSVLRYINTTANAMCDELKWHALIEMVNLISNSKLTLCIRKQSNSIFNSNHNCNLRIELQLL